MRPLLCVTLIAMLAGPSFGLERVLQEWDFTRADDTLGWTAAEGVDEFRNSDSTLIAGSSAGALKLDSPPFDIDAAAWQYVEIELKPDADGVAKLCYAKGPEGPDGGFSQDNVWQFYIEARRDFNTYTVFPFWHQLGKIARLRLELPGKSVAIRAVRIIGGQARATTAPPLWRFNDTTADWQSVVNAGEHKTTPSGWEISGTNRVIVLSPPIDIEADNCSWVTLRIASKTDHTALFQWATPAAPGLQSAAIPLRGDEAVHSYTLDLGRSRSWAGRIQAVAVTPTDSRESRSITLESVALADAPVGPPELTITRIGLADPFVRVGDETKLVVEATNTGGSEASSVAAVVLVRNGEGSTMLPAKRAATIAPGKAARFEWPIHADAAGTRVAVCRVNGLELFGEQKTARLTFYPALDQSLTAAADYVPGPQPADTGDYLVGAYYFPGWDSYARWAVLDDFPERKPLLGYYREGSPEIADWQINWALSHGISFFIYDWYWSKGVRQLDHALNDGFLESRFQDRFKFCLLWANHNPPGTSSEEDLISVTRYWLEHYFHHPSYLKLGGKNVVVIFAPNRLTEDMTSTGVKAAFPKMRKMCEDAGVGGLYLVACTYPDPEAIKVLQYEGYDALSGYNYPFANSKGTMRAPYQWAVEGYKDSWNQIDDAAPTPYIPVCEVGWDARPWHGPATVVRTGKSPLLWEQMLRNAKEFVDRRGRKLPAGKKMTFLEAWNEYGEGDYIEPHAEYGFDYLTAVKNVFAPSAEEVAVVVPEDLGMGPYDYAGPESVTAWDFSQAECEKWRAGPPVTLAYSKGVLRAQAKGGPPVLMSPLINIDAAKFNTVEIKMRMDKGNRARLYFAMPRGAMSEPKSVEFPITVDDEFHVYEVDMTRNSHWKGTIGQIRLDPTEAAASNTEIGYIKLKQ